MAQTIDYTKPNFLHWEADPSNSRETIQLKEAAEAGQLVIFTGADKGKATSQVTESNTKNLDGLTGEIYFAITLEAGEADSKVLAIVRNATVLTDKIKVAQDADAVWANLKGLAQDASISLRTSIAVEPSITP